MQKELSVWQRQQQSLRRRKKVFYELQKPNIHYCQKCGFPTVRLMSSRPNCVAMVWCCLNCGSETP
jgi:ribosomal protein L37AE/L43A